MENTPLDPPLRSYRLKDLLFAPIGCLMSIPPIAVLGVFVAALLTGLYIFYNVNTEFLGIGRPPFNQMEIDRTWEHVTMGELRWTVQYESYTPTVFQGSVRYAGPIRQQGIPFLTHDILVTSGDFADPQLVSTSVINHHFSWSSGQAQYPQGSINLLHSVPQNEAIYQQLLTVQNGQRLRITGFEIQIIDAYNRQGKRYLWWQDTGCNTLLITRVEPAP